MPVSGVVIRCNPERTEELERSLPLQGLLEISHVLDDGSLIAVIAATTVDEEVATVKNIMEVDGVLDVRVVYHNFEDLVDPA